MSCSPFDLRDYALKELSETERQQVEAHVRACAPCREEVERLRLTEAALFALRDEEIPQRIAFVSDKIFEPSPWRRAWTAFWGSTARLGFASAAMFSTALIVFSLARPAGTPWLETAKGPAAVRVTAASVPDEVIQQRIQAAVDKAVADQDARLQKAFDQRVAEIERRNEVTMLRAASELNFMQKEQMTLVRSSYNLPRTGNGEFK